MAQLAAGSHRSEGHGPFNSRLDVVVVSPNTLLRQQIEEKLLPQRWRVLQTGSTAGALKLLCEQDINGSVLLLDPMLFDFELDGVRGLLAERFPDVPVLMLNPQTGQLLMGAEPDSLSTKLVNTINSRGASASGIAVSLAPNPRASLRDELRIKLRGMIGNADSMQRIWNETRKMAPRNMPVLITGESGTGKNLLAQEIHLISNRRNQPFVVVNCSAIPEFLLEKELFGYAKGARIGPKQSHIGLIHAAHGGTLFLDEISDMPLSPQAKILRFLEQGEVKRLGDNDNVKVDVRVIAATKVDLKGQVANQQFREDLYHRLAFFSLHLPPLRERMEDLEALARSFAAKFLPGAVVTRQALEVLAEHSWPGNLRELRNAIERSTMLIGADRKIKPEHIFF